MIVKELLESGLVKPVIDRCYSLRETAEALRCYGEGHALGRVVNNNGTGYEKEEVKNGKECKRVRRITANEISRDCVFISS